MAQQSKKLKLIPYFEMLPKELVVLILGKVKENRLSVLLVCKEWLFLGRELYAPSLISRGIRYIRSNNFDKALKCYDKLLELNEKGIRFTKAQIIRIHNNRATTLHRMGRIEEAIKHNDIVLEMDSSNLISLNNKGDNLNELKRWEEAIPYFDKVLAIEPTRLSSLYNKGNSYLYLFRLEEAVEMFKEALRHHPNDTDSLGNCACALYHQGKYNEAITYCDRAIKIEPDNKVALSIRRMSFEQLKLTRKCNCGLCRISKEFKEAREKRLKSNFSQPTSFITPPTKTMALTVTLAPSQTTSQTESLEQINMEDDDQMKTTQSGNSPSHTNDNNDDEKDESPNETSNETSNGPSNGSDLPPIDEFIEDQNNNTVDKINTSSDNNSFQSSFPKEGSV